MSLISLEPMHRAAEIFNRAAAKADQQRGAALREWAEGLSAAPLAIYRDEIAGRAAELEELAGIPQLIVEATLDEGFLDDARLEDSSGETTHTFRPGAFEASIRRIGVADALLSTTDRSTLRELAKALGSLRDSLGELT